jgi:hypothetical protein
MPTTTQASGKTPIIFDHQTSAYEKLCRAGNVCFSPQRAHLPVQPRTNSLLIGPSGSGKSYLARAVAESFGFECKALTVAEWMLLGSGSKGSQRTWNAIFEFLLKNHSKKGAVIFLDEIDKLTGTSDWVQHLRLGVFRLLDLAVPPDLINGDDNRYARTTFSEVEEFLRRRTFIIAAGAFQFIWDEGGKQIGGFGGDPGGAHWADRKWRPAAIMGDLSLHSCRAASCGIRPPADAKKGAQLAQAQVAGCAESLVKRLVIVGPSRHDLLTRRPKFL